MQELSINTNTALGLGQDHNSYNCSQNITFKGAIWELLIYIDTEYNDWDMKIRWLLLVSFGLLN